MSKQFSFLMPLPQSEMKKMKGGAAAPSQWLCADRETHTVACFATKGACLAACPTPSNCTPFAYCN